MGCARCNSAVGHHVNGGKSHGGNHLTYALHQAGSSRHAVLTLKSYYLLTSLLYYDKGKEHSDIPPWLNRVVTDVSIMPGYNQSTQREGAWKQQGKTKTAPPVSSLVRFLLMHVAGFPSNRKSMFCISSVFVLQ